LQGSQVTISGISKRFGAIEVLKKVSLDIKKGEFFSLLGPSGCGKTTLLRIIAGFESPSSGDVRLDEHSVLALSPNERHVNTVFQNYALFPHLSVFENVAFPLRLKKVAEGTIREQVGTYLDLVKLNEHSAKLPSQLSGGQKQRVAIARALINNPSVLLLDEPLAALDAKLRQHMLVELDRIHDKVGITFIYVTHDQQEAISVSDRVAVFSEGEVLQVGSPTEIYERPADEFVANFIGETNYLRGTVVSVEQDYAMVAVAGMGALRVCQDKPCTVGNAVSVTVRPEKIRIGREAPSAGARPLNVVRGSVEEIVYTGFQSRFYITIEGAPQLKVFVPHSKQDNEQAVTYSDAVAVWWDADDAFLVESVER
jgi:spermidine/putrescine transport system ATP-binding protein